MGISECLWEDEVEREKANLRQKTEMYEKQISDEEVNKRFGRPSMSNFLEMRCGEYYKRKKHKMAIEKAVKELGYSHYSLI